MWRIWMIFEPRRALIGLAVFLFSLAIIIHFILLSSDRFNWIDGPSVSISSDAVESEAQASVPVRLIG
jgi:light-harvesting complex 1 alpha chain